jgi:hypothetical protein
VQLILVGEVAGVPTETYLLLPAVKLLLTAIVLTVVEAFNKEVLAV